MLARSEDEALQDLARAELNGPGRAEEQFELAEGWRKYGKDLDEQRRLVLWEHAVVWYQRALPRIEDEELRQEIRERIATFFKNAKKRGYVPVHVSPQTFKPPAPQPPASTPGNEEAGLYVLKCTGGHAKRQLMTAFRATGTWTNNDQLWWTGGKPGDILNLGLKAPEKGRYAVKAILTKSIDYGIVQFYVKGEKLGEPHDGYSPRVTNAPWQTLGVVKLSAGHHILTVKIVGTNPKSKPRYYFGIDELRLKPVE
jgi:hypothetical protein